MTVTRQDIVDEARSWLGVPWRHQGRTRDEGVDCGGLIVVVALKLGLILPKHDPSRYARQPNYNYMLEVCRAGMDRVSELQPGDVVVVKPSEASRFPSHMGIISRMPDGDLGVIHAYGTPGRKKSKKVDGVVETHYAGWEERTIGRFKFRGVADE